MHLHARRYLTLGGVFLAGIILGRFLLSYLALPFQNPLQVVGYCAKIQFNPLNNFVRFLVFVFLPPVSLILLAGLGGRGLTRWLFPVSNVSGRPTEKKQGTAGKPWIGG